MTFPNGSPPVDSAKLAGQATLRRRFDLILSTLNMTFDLNAYLGMLKPQGKLCVVAQPLEMLSISVGMLYDNAPAGSLAKRAGVDARGATGEQAVMANRERLTDGNGTTRERHEATIRLAQMRLSMLDIAGAERAIGASSGERDRARLDVSPKNSLPNVLVSRRATPQ